MRPTLEVDRAKRSSQRLEYFPPALGKGTMCRGLGKNLDIPATYFNKLSHWNEFSMLRGSKFYRELRSLLKRAVEPDRIQRFIHFIDAEMRHELSYGFPHQTPALK